MKLRSSLNRFKLYMKGEGYGIMIILTGLLGILFFSIGILLQRGAEVGAASGIPYLIAGVFNIVLMIIFIWAVLDREKEWSLRDD